MQIVDEGKQRAIVIKKEGFPDAVVWNPWREKAAGMADFGNDEYKVGLCLNHAAASNHPSIMYIFAAMLNVHSDTADMNKLYGCFREWCVWSRLWLEAVQSAFSPGSCGAPSRSSHCGSYESICNAIEGHMQPRNRKAQGSENALAA